MTPEQAKELRREARERTKKLAAVGSKEQHEEDQPPAPQASKDEDEEDAIPLDQLSKPRPAPVALDSEDEKEDVMMPIATRVVKPRSLAPTLEKFDSKELMIVPDSRVLRLQIGDKPVVFRIVVPVNVVGRMWKNKPFNKDGGEDKFEVTVNLELDEASLKKMDEMDRRCRSLMKKLDKVEGRAWKPLSHPTELMFSRAAGGMVRVMPVKITDTTQMILLEDSKPGEVPKALQQGAGEEFFEEVVKPLKNVAITGEVSFKCAWEMKGQCGIGKPSFWQVHFRTAEPAPRNRAGSGQVLNQEQLDRFFEV